MPLSALVVDDDHDLATLVEGLLSLNGFDVHKAATGDEALRKAADRPFDLITLDLGLPDVDGLLLCRSLRRTSDAYIVVLSASNDERDKLVTLETGADDFVTKPFSNRELVARVHAMLRRPRVTISATPPRLQVETGARVARLDGRPLTLTRTEFDLLAALMGANGEVVSREQLLQQGWGATWGADHHLVDVHVANLRQKLRQREPDQQWIATVRGIGFRLDLTGTRALGVAPPDPLELAEATPVLPKA